jgi:hypothetical protein
VPASKRGIGSSEHLGVAAAGFEHSSGALYSFWSSPLSANLPSNRQPAAMNENFSLIVMCLFLLGSLAFLAQQLTSYH